MNAFFSHLGALAVLLTEFIATDPVTPEQRSQRAHAMPAAEDTFQRISEKSADEDHIWTAPFVMADREKEKVFVWGHYTGLHEEEIVEFFAIGKESGQDYETLFVSYALPSDIHRALEAIGLSPGHPFSSVDHQFWPRGPRVDAEFFWQPDPENPPRRHPVSDLVNHLGQPMPPFHWVFTGAPTLPSIYDESEMVYSADEREAVSIASTFNLTHTVFDLPFQASKGGVYGHFIRNGTHPAPEGQPMLLILSPASGPDTPREKDISLKISTPPPYLSSPELESIEDLASLKNLLEESPNSLLYATIHFDAELSVSNLAAWARRLFGLEQSHPAFRADPPPEGHPFYRSFLPDPGFRTREERPSQPVELYLEQEDGGLRAHALHLDEIWGEERIPRIVSRRTELADPAKWTDYVQNPEHRRPALFVFADDTLPYGELLKWITPVLDGFPVVFVYSLHDDE